MPVGFTCFVVLIFSKKQQQIDNEFENQKSMKLKPERPLFFDLFRVNSLNKLVGDNSANDGQVTLHITLVETSLMKS